MPLARRTVAVVALAATGAQAGSLAPFLDAVARNARFPAPTAAEVRIERRRDDASASGRAAIVGNRRTIYVETPDGTRALVRPGKIVVRTGGRIARAPVGTRLGDTDLLLEDLVVFTPGMLKVPQVSDEGPTGTVVTGAPAFPSARALLVLTIDPATHAVMRTKCYEGSISDLAAYRHDDEVVTVDGHTRTKVAVVDRPRDGTSTRLELTWRAAPELPPTLFRLSGLRAASPIRW